MHPTLGLQSSPLQLPSETSPRPHMPRASRHLWQTSGLPAGLHWDVPSPSNLSWLLGPVTLILRQQGAVPKTGLCLMAPRWPEPASPADSSSQLHVCTCVHTRTHKPTQEPSPPPPNKGIRYRLLCLIHMKRTPPWARMGDSMPSSSFSIRMGMKCSTSDMSTSPR